MWKHCSSVRCDASMTRALARLSSAHPSDELPLGSVLHLEASIGFCGTRGAGTRQAAPVVLEKSATSNLDSPVPASNLPTDEEGPHLFPLDFQRNLAGLGDEADVGWIAISIDRHVDTYRVCVLIPPILVGCTIVVYLGGGKGARACGRSVVRQGGVFECRVPGDGGWRPS